MKGKVVLVTGGARRVGRAIATKFARQGADLAIHYHSSHEEALRVAVELRAHGVRVELFSANLSIQSEAEGLIDNVLGKFGRMDVLVASAANFDRVEIANVDRDAWARAMALNLEAPLWMVLRARTALAKASGNVIFMTCTSATAPYRNYLPYVVSKGALRQLMRVLALELAPHVRVNAIAPGTVLPPEDMSSGALESLGAAIPLGLTGSADDLAEAAWFLATNTFVTGEELLIDGGRSI